MVSHLPRPRRTDLRRALLVVCGIAAVGSVLVAVSAGGALGRANPAASHTIVGQHIKHPDHRSRFAGKTTTTHAVYTGHFGGLPEQTVRLRAAYDRGQIVAVTFSAQKVKLFCEDGTTRVVDVAPLRLKTRSGRAFWQLAVAGSDNSGRVYTEVDGHFLGSKARGFFYRFDNAPAASSEPDCSGGYGPDVAPWKAHRR